MKTHFLSFTSWLLKFTFHTQPLLGNILIILLYSHYFQSWILPLFSKCNQLYLKMSIWIHNIKNILQVLIHFNLIESQTIPSLASESFLRNLQWVQPSGSFDDVLASDTTGHFRLVISLCCPRSWVSISLRRLGFFY